MAAGAAAWAHRRRRCCHRQARGHLRRAHAPRPARCLGSPAPAVLQGKAKEAKLRKELKAMFDEKGERRHGPAPRAEAPLRALAWWAGQGGA